MSARPVEGQAVVYVSFSGCNADPGISVDETDAVVRITIEQPDQGCEPLFEKAIGLDAPVGDRVVIDGATGEQVPEGLG